MDAMPRFISSLLLLVTLVGCDLKSSGTNEETVDRSPKLIHTESEMAAYRSTPEEIEAGMQQARENFVPPEIGIPAGRPEDSGSIAESANLDWSPPAN